MLGVGIDPIRHALRNFRRSPGVFGAAALCLGLGIGVNVAMVDIVDTLLFRPPAHVLHPEGVVRISYTLHSSQFGSITESLSSYPKFIDVRDGTRSFSAVAAYAPIAIPVAVGKGIDAQRAFATLVTPEFFTLLGVRPSAGRFFSPDEGGTGASDAVVVISYDFWKRRFAEDEAVLGQEISIGGRTWTVIGVSPRGFSGAELRDVDAWLPISSASGSLMIDSWAHSRSSSWLKIVGRLRDHVSKDAAQGDVQRAVTLGDPTIANADIRTSYSLNPILIDRGPDRTQNARIATWLAMLSLAVVLISCANVANLLLARAIARRRDLAVRLALGAGRAHLARQLLAESLLVAVGGGVVATLILVWIGAIARHYLLPGLEAAGGTAHPRMIAYMTVLIVGTGLLCGLSPVRLASRLKLDAVLKSGGRESTSRTGGFGAILVVGQVALCVVLLVAAGLFAKSLYQLRRLDLGIEASNVLAATIDLHQAGLSSTDMDGMEAAVMERVRALPGVEKVSLSLTLPFHSALGMSIHLPDQRRLPRISTGTPYMNAVSRDYFATLSVAIRRGRAFTDEDHRGAQRVAVVNETMASLIWPGGDAVGQCIRLGDSWAPCTEVVGVAENTRRSSIIEDPMMLLFIPLAQNGFRHDERVLLVRSSAKLPEMIPLVRREIQLASAKLPFVEVKPLQELIDPQIRPWRLGTTMFGIFACLAVGLAAVGLYGVMAYSTLQRTREIGVRIALGAPVVSVLVLIVRRGVSLAALGIAIGTAVSLAARPLIAPLLFQVRGSDPAVLAAVAGILLIVTIAASYVPARRATRVDPTVALRAD